MDEFRVQTDYIKNSSEYCVPSDPAIEEPSDLDLDDTDGNLVIDMKPIQTQENGHMDMNLPPEFEITIAKVGFRM